MLASSVSIRGLLLILNLQLFTSFPIMSDTDVDMLKVRQQKVPSSRESSAGEHEVRGICMEPRCLVKAPMVDLADPSSVWNHVDLLSVVLTS